jgi:hypothetical protein
MRELVRDGKARAMTNPFRKSASSSILLKSRREVIAFTRVTSNVDDKSSIPDGQASIRQKMHKVNLSNPARRRDLAEITPRASGLP